MNEQRRKWPWFEDADESGGEHYFYAAESPQTMLTLDKTEPGDRSLRAIAGASRRPPDRTLFIEKRQQFADRCVDIGEAEPDGKILARRRNASSDPSFS